MQEYGIFSDEGLIDQDFWSYEAAEEAMDREYADEDDRTYIHVGEVCNQCRANECTAEDGCEECDTDDDSEEI